MVLLLQLVLLVLLCVLKSLCKSVRVLGLVLHSDINELNIYICHQSLIAISNIIKVQMYLFDS